MTGNGSCIRFKKNMYIGDTLSESFPLLFCIIYGVQPMIMWKELTSQTSKQIIGNCYID